MASRARAETLGVSSGTTRQEVDLCPSEVVTVDELAVLLRVDRKLIYAAVAASVLPGVRRFGRAIRIHRQTVLDWLSHGGGNLRG